MRHCSKANVAETSTPARKLRVRMKVRLRTDHGKGRVDKLLMSQTICGRSLPSSTLDECSDASRDTLCTTVHIRSPQTGIQKLVSLEGPETTTPDPVIIGTPQSPLVRVPAPETGRLPVTVPRSGRTSHPPDRLDL